MEVAYVPTIHPLWTLCLLTELGSKRLISVGEENIRDSLFRKEGRSVHLTVNRLTFTVKSTFTLLYVMHIYNRIE